MFPIMQPQDFPRLFNELTGSLPFPWQASLFDEFVRGEIRESANLPTGLGKTSIVAIWLCALAFAPGKTPRRLVYVVNRRTVVDQTTAEAERLRNALNKPELADIRDRLVSLCALPLPTSDASPLAISTLRGQFADNGEWCADPSRPAVIVGTVDMIGSGLLFSRYTRSFKTRPLHAGLLGQDALLVHDEAHLEPAFQELLESIVAAQSTDPHKLRVIELTATSRISNAESKPPFTLSAADHENKTVKERLNAIKRLSLVALDDGEKLEAKLAKLAKAKSRERAVLIFTRSVDVAVKVAAELDKGERKGKVATLTGTMRGKERDELVTGNQVFQRFLSEKDRSRDVQPTSGAVFLVATSAGEVGVNISADDLVCDLSTFESMAQRFGRVNRFGQRKEDDASEITVVHEMSFDTDEPIEVARKRTLMLLKRLNGSASPAALDELPPAERAAAFSPPPEMRVATDIQFDAWALTSIRQPIAARPPVAPYLHGEAEWQPPETHVAWRDERDFQYIEDPEAFLDDFPLTPAELLRDKTSRIAKTLAKLLDGRTDLPNAWLIAENGSISRFALSAFEKDTAETLLADTTLILPATVGGLDKKGLFSVMQDTAVNDVSGIIRHEAASRDNLPDNAITFVRFIEISDENAEEPRYLLWCKPGPESGNVKTVGSRNAQAESLAHHTDIVVANAAAIAAKCFPEKSALAVGEPDLRRCITVAARLHDLGKNRLQWQRNIGNFAYDAAKPDTILAKSGPGMRPRNVSEHYRHELGSLLDAESKSKLASLNEAERDIVLHMVAAHHGRARPHFPADELFDYLPGSHERLAALAIEVPRRFAHLQERFGRWGLAWLESLLRAADYAASAGIVAPSVTTAMANGQQNDDSGPRPPVSEVEKKITPTATLAINPANPGHYFACCGLFELASRISVSANTAGPALAWFEQSPATRQWQFHLANSLPLEELLKEITSAEIVALNLEDRAKSALEIRLLAGKTKLRIDWWRHEGGAVGKLKPWAGNTSVRDIADDMLKTLKTELAGATAVSNEHILSITSTANTGEPFYFDANRAVNARAQDVGFSIDKLKKGGIRISTSTAPAVELLALVGVQRARPLVAFNERGREREYDYYFWREPISIAVVAATVSGLLEISSAGFRFANPSRAKDYRAFAPGKALHEFV